MKNVYYVNGISFMDIDGQDVALVYACAECRERPAGVNDADLEAMLEEQLEAGLILDYVIPGYYAGQVILAAPPVPKTINGRR